MSTGINWNESCASDKYVDQETKSAINKKDFSYFVEKNINKKRFIFVDSHRYGIVWKNAFAFLILHVVSLGTIIHLLINRVFEAWIFSLCYGFFAVLGVTVGAHRLWSHKCFKAKLPLRIALMIMQTMAGQNDLYTWCRDHRLHHKFSETDADPHNSKRGFFFTHVGWLLTKKHPEVILKGKTIDCSDLLKDPVIVFQRKYYIYLYTFFCFLLPTILCYYFIGESWINSFLVGCFLRYILSLHVTWFVNSAAHMFGDRPFNPKIAARENKYVVFACWGSEGFHNYHHVFPSDYTISELGFKFNPMKSFIEMMAKCGQAYDLRRPSKQLIQKTLQKGTKNLEFVDPYEKPHIFS